MPAVCKIGDIGIGTCPCHTSPVGYTTTLISGAATVNTNNQQTGIISSLGVSSCGHMTTAMTGSPNVNATKQPVHRVGDMGQNCGPYSMITGSANVNANDNG